MVSVSLLHLIIMKSAIGWMRQGHVFVEWGYLDPVYSVKLIRFVSIRITSPALTLGSSLDHSSGLA